MAVEEVVIRDQDSFQSKVDGRTRHQVDTETMVVVADVIITEVTSVDEVAADMDGGNVKMNPVNCSRIQISRLSDSSMGRPSGKLLLL